MRVGFTVSKKVGNAVTRNRLKRRLRALAAELLPTHGQAGADHVLIGRAGEVERDFGVMRVELERALRRVTRAPANAGAQSVAQENAAPSPDRLGSGVRRSTSA